MNTKILVCCHKKDVYVSEDPYFPIQVGKTLSDIDLGIVGDDTGENISQKNGSYCELTGMYWAWKNLKDVDVIGLCHYRRYFDFHHQCGRFFPYKNFSKTSLDSLDFSVPKDILKVASSGSIIISKPIHYPYSLATDYCVAHISDDFRVLQETIRRTQPNQVVQAFNKYMYHNNALSHYNMFLMSWKNFDHYCKWLFGILEKVEESIDITAYNPIQKRIFGFMAERLLNIYLLANNQITIEKPVLRICDPANNLPPYVFLRNKIRFYLANKVACSNNYY